MLHGFELAHWRPAEGAARAVPLQFSEGTAPALRAEGQQAHRGRIAGGLEDAIHFKQYILFMAKISS